MCNTPAVAVLLTVCDALAIVVLLTLCDKPVAAVVYFHYVFQLVDMGGGGGGGGGGVRFEGKEGRGGGKKLSQTVKFSKILIAAEHSNIYPLATNVSILMWCIKKQSYRKTTKLQWL